MCDCNRPRFDYDVAELVGKRLEEMLKGLNTEHAMAAIEEFIDDYTHSFFGVGVMDSLRKVKLPDEGRSQCIQTIAEGRAVLVSAYGFRVIKDENCKKCGGALIVLDEMSRKDRDKEMESMG